LPQIRNAIPAIAGTTATTLSSPDFVFFGGECRVIRDLKTLARFIEFLKI